MSGRRMTRRERERRAVGRALATDGFHRMTSRALAGERQLLGAWLLSSYDLLVSHRDPRLAARNQFLSLADGFPYLGGADVHEMAPARKVVAETVAVHDNRSPEKGLQTDMAVASVHCSLTVPSCRQ